MKRMLFLLLIILLSLGCSIHIPLTGKLEYSSIAEIQSSPRHPAKIAVYIDRDLREKVIVQGASGFGGAGSLTNVAIGNALANSLLESLSLSFSEVRVLSSAAPREDLTFLSIKAENLKISFEYSAYPFQFEPALDRAKIFLLLKTDITESKGKTSTNLLSFTEEEEEHNIPAPTKAGVLERCLNRIAIQYAREIKSAVPMPSPDH